MTDEENRQLAKLVTYLLESEDWKCIWINEYAEPIRMFLFRTGITYRRVHKYIKEALQKLLGPVYNTTQRRLANKCCGENDLLFKPKTKQIKTEPKKHSHNAGKTLVPWSEFGRKYLEHYRISEVPKTRLNMLVKEKSIKRLVRFLGRNKEKVGMPHIGNTYP